MNPALYQLSYAAVALSGRRTGEDTIPDGFDKIRDARMVFSGRSPGSPLKWQAQSFYLGRTIARVSAPLFGSIPRSWMTVGYHCVFSITPKSLPPIG